MKLINLRKHPISTSLVSIIEEKMENSFFSAKREYGYFDTKWMTNCDKAVNSYFVNLVPRAFSLAWRKDPGDEVDTLYALMASDSFLCPLLLNAAGVLLFQGWRFP